MTTLTTERSLNVFSISVRVKIFFFRLDPPDWLWDPPSLLVDEKRKRFSWVKRLELEADYSPPPSMPSWLARSFRRKTWVHNMT